MQIIEQFIEGKRPDPKACEDVIFISEHYAAVIDGATDIKGTKYDGKSGGRFAAENIAESISKLNPEADAFSAVKDITANLADALKTHSNAGDDGRPPSAVFVIYSRHRREVWRLGDSPFRIGEKVYRSDKMIDEVTLAWRRAWTTALLVQGATTDELRMNDPGLSAMWPLVQMQDSFANTTGTPYSYGVINGSFVPKEHVEVYSVPTGDDVVLASDGYPELLPDLESSEKYLHHVIKEDPLSVRLNMSGRAVHPSWNSYDDRAFVKLRSLR